MEPALLGESCERETVPSPWELPSTRGRWAWTDMEFRGSEESAAASCGRQNRERPVKMVQVTSRCIHPDKCLLGRAGTARWNLGFSGKT